MDLPGDECGECWGDTWGDIDDANVDLNPVCDCNAWLGM